MDDEFDLELERELEAAFEADVWEDGPNSPSSSDEPSSEQEEEDDDLWGGVPSAPCSPTCNDGACDPGTPCCTDPLGEDPCAAGKNSGVEEDVNRPGPSKRKEREEDSSIPVGPAKRRATAAESGMLNVLPKEVWLRALSFLSAVDLTSASSVCSRMREMCNEDFLWKRLYCHRWGAAKGGPKRSSWEQSWKASYMERDGADMNDILNEVSCTQMQEAFKQMQVALREYSFPDSCVDEVLLAESQVAKQVQAWQASRGFVREDGSVKHDRPDLSKRGQYRFHKIGSDTFCCEETGWVHVCGEACREKIVDRDSGLLVCPISGVTTDRMMTQWECEEACEQLPQTEEGAEDYGSRLARAFCEGYNCANERELQWRCGVKLT